MGNGTVEEAQHEDDLSRRLRVMDGRLRGVQHAHTEGEGCLRCEAGELMQETAIEFERVWDALRHLKSFADALFPEQER